MGWENIGEAVKFEFKKKGNNIEGKLIDMKTTRFESKVYTILTCENLSLYFFGCHRLDSLLPALMGRFVKITYKGVQKLKDNKTLREFDVDVWKGTDGELPEGFEDDVPF